MMRFCDTEPQREILSAIKEVLVSYGMNCLRADERTYAPSLWENVKSYMDACRFGIAVFEQIGQDDFNPNVSLELGYMLAQKKEVLLLKETRLRTMPTDVAGHLYKTFDSSNLEGSVRVRILEWLQDIGIAKSSGDSLVLFVSHGGTCRCAMAKVALDQLLIGRELPYSLRVVSVAHAFGGVDRASQGARQAVLDAYGKDFLKRHRVTRRNDGLLADADLILVMEDKLKEGLPSDKTFKFNDFLGLSGDVDNPWPEKGEKHGDESVRLKYKNCMHHLQEAISKGADNILRYLDQEHEKAKQLKKTRPAALGADRGDTLLNGRR
jgi:protein-tyrosine-phosphatase